MPDTTTRTRDTDAATADRERLNRLAELIESVRFAMLTTHGPDGTLRARPLTTLHVEHGPTLRLAFIIPAEGDIAQEVAAQAQVNVSYANPAKDIYASVAARAELSEDLARKRELWNAMVQAWFPGGPDDPDSVLLVAELEGAEYWHVEQGKLAQTFQMLKAAARGTQPELDAEHQKIAG